MEDFVLPCMLICGIYIYIYVGVYILVYIRYIYVPCLHSPGVCGIYIYIYIYIYMCHAFITREPGVHRTFYRLDKRKWLSRKIAIDKLDSSMMDEENGCRFEGQRKETWIYTRPAWLIAIRKRCWSFIQI